MGLSDYERNQKILWAVHNLTTLGKKIQEEELYIADSDPDYQKIKSLTEELWYSIWGKSGNGGFWLFGSDTNIQRDNCSLWSVALYDKVAVRKEGVIYMDDLKKERELSILDEMLKLDQLIEVYSHNDGVVYEIYQWVQQIQYAVNRYQDELAAKHIDLMKICSKLIGECFSVFSRSENFALAYIMCQVSELLYTKNSDPKDEKKWDVATKYLVENHGHHAIRNPFNHLPPISKLDEAKKLWKSLYLDQSEENRLFLFYSLVERHEFDHKYKKLIEIAEEKGWDIEKFKKMAKENVALKKEKDKEQTNEWKEDKEFYTKDILGIE